MYARILVPVDGSPPSEAGLAEAIRIARAGGGELRLLHLVEDLLPLPMSAIHGVALPDLSALARGRAEALLERCVAQAREAGVDAEPMLLEGLGRHLADFVADQVRSWDADLIVLGTHGRRGIGRLLLGSDAEQVIRVAPVPVLLVHEPRAAPGA